MSDVNNFKKFRGGIRLETQEDDPSSNLEEGAIVYNSTEKSLKVHNGSGFAAVGGGSGGSLDTFYTENFETILSSDFSKVNEGTLGFETTNPLNGNRSLKYTFGSNTTQSITSPSFEPPVKANRQTCSISFWYHYDGADDDVRIVIKDGGYVISSSSDLLKATHAPGTTPMSKKFTTTFTRGTSVLSWGFEVASGSAITGKILVIDDVEISQDPFVQADLGTITDWETYEPATTSTSGGSGSLHEGRWRRVGDSMEVVFELLLGNSGVGSDPAVVGLPTSVASSPWKNDYEVDPILTPSKKRIIGKFWIAQGGNEELSGAEGVSGTEIDRNYVITFNSSYPGFVQLADQSVGGGNPNTELEICNWDSFEGRLGPSDKIYGKFTVPIKSWGSTNTHIITPAKSNLTDWKSYSLTSPLKLNSAQGVNSNGTLGQYRRVGDSIEVKFAVKYDGAGHGSVFTVALPDGLTFDTDKIPTVNADGAGYLGSCVWYNAGRSTSDMQVGYYSSTTIKVFGDHREIEAAKTGGGEEYTNELFSNRLENNDYISGTFTAPIAEWSAQDSNFLAALPMTKWQRKVLLNTYIGGQTTYEGVDYGSDTAAALNAVKSRLSFSNLTEGKFYRITSQIAIEENKDVNNFTKFLYTTGGGSKIAQSSNNFPYHFTYNASTNPTSTRFSILTLSGTFIADSTGTLNLTLSDWDHNSGEIIYGQATSGVTEDNGHYHQTWTLLEELPMHEKVEIW